MASGNKVNRRRALKIIVGAGILVVAGVVVSTLRIFTPKPSTTVATNAAISTATTSAAAVSTTVATSAVSVSNTGVVAWPRLKATNAKSLEESKPLVFDYPLVGISNMLVKLGAKADNGVGPDGDIVAFSRVCQHQGCLISFLGVAYEGNCPCHGSQYDFIHNGSIISGPTTQPVPRVLLEFDAATGDIYVVGMGPPIIYGQGPQGGTDPAEVLQYDLQGGQIVTKITLSPL
jgi:arsenite oxidase small subunit